MQTTISEERVLLFKDVITPEKAKELALSKKIDAFGTVEKLASFLSKPKDDDFQILYSEHRYQPFWHIKGAYSYIYDRKTINKWPILGSEVRNITINEKDYSVKNQTVEIESVEHCTEQDDIEALVDGITGEKQPTLQKYISCDSTILEKEKLEAIDAKKDILIPPKTRVSALINEILAHSVRVIHADKVFEEKIEIKQVDLCYRPVYAFQFQWVSKKREIVIEIDGLTGEITYGNKLFKEYLGKALDTNFLFDVGADVAGMVVPGGSIAVKIVKKYIDTKTQKK